MSEASKFKFPGLGQRQKPESDDYEALLELIPHAVLLVDPKSEQILLANSLASDLSAYTRSELTGLGINTLIPDWEEIGSETEASQTSYPREMVAPKRDITTELIRRDLSKISIVVTFIDNKRDDHNYLLALQTFDTWRQPQLSQHSYFWDSLNKLANSQQEIDLSAAIASTLEAGKSLTHADIMAVYLASQEQPLLRKASGLGSHHLLPSELTAQDLIDLNKPQVWTIGKRTSSTLHRTARQENLSYLTSAPIGQPDAIIGLIVVADSQAPPPLEIIPTAELLATVNASILQGSSQVANIKLDLEEQLYQNEIKKIIDNNIGEGVMLLDTNLDIIRLNNAAELALGYLNDEISGQPIDKIIIGSQSLQPALKEAIQGSATFNLDDLRLYRRNGEAFSALVRVFPVMRGENINEILLFIQDLSERERLGAQARENDQREALGEVTAIFAHEIRNPINNISTGLQLMSYNLPQEDSNQEAIGRMLQDCDRLAELIKSVLAFSRPMDYDMEILDVERLLTNLLERLKPRIHRRNIKYDLQIEDGCPPIMGNLRALEQVFNNLIQNAMHAMEPAGGRLGIKVQIIQSAWGKTNLIINVADTGHGIPEEQIERIFQPFVTTKKGGTGLGLPIASRIITEHKGNLTVDSFPGGTVFQIKIPAANPDQSEG